MSRQTTKQTGHPIETAIMSHVQRYQLTTAEAACRAEVRGMTSLDVSRDRLEALVRRGELDRVSIDGRTTGYVPRRPIEIPPSTQQKMQWYGCLAFCCLQDQPRVKLAAAEMQKQFPGFAIKPSSARSYYLSKGSSQTRLGFVRVDTGGRGRWDRIVAKFAADLHEHWQNEFVQKLLQADSFEACLVTALPTKAERIASSIGSHLETIHIPVRCVAVPRLVDILAPQPD